MTSLAVTILVVPVLVATVAGCGVRRVLTVRSVPSGAAVYINGREEGRTPLNYEFTFYGTLDVELRHAGLPDESTGYRTEHLQKKLVIPWYQHFPIDFVSEFLVPWPITNRHALSVELTRYPDPNRDEGDLVREEEKQEIAESIAEMKELLSSPTEEGDGEGEPVEEEGPAEEAEELAPSAEAETAA